MAPQNASPKKEPAWQKAFLAALAVSGNVSASAKAAKIDRTTASRRRAADEPFALAWAQALDEAADTLELEARRRAHDGLVRYKFNRKGDPLVFPGTQDPYYELEYSDTLLIFLLKAARPEKYRERLDVRQETRVTVIEDESWYGNDAHRLAAQGAAPSGADSPGPGPS